MHLQLWRSHLRKIHRDEDESAFIEKNIFVSLELHCDKKYIFDESAFMQRNALTLKNTVRRLRRNKQNYSDDARAYAKHGRPQNAE